MTLADAMRKAVRERDPVAAGAVADFCWLRLGWNYHRTYEEVRKVTGVSLPKWETLLYEADTEVPR